MRLLPALILIALVSVPSYGQGEVVRDTLDWRGYYPLEVGNAWEWVTELQFFYRAVDRHELVSDTLVDGQRYFVRHEIRSETHMGDFTVRVNTRLLRYDSTHANVREYTSEEEEWAYTCDLSAEFGSDNSCEIGEVHVFGGYAGDGACLGFGTKCAPYAAEKTFVTSAGGGSGTFYHGVGMVPNVPEGAQGGVELTYVRVNGEEYGERVVFLGTDDVPPPALGRLSLYPNPTRDHVWITLSDSAVPQIVSVYDVLGRTVLMDQPCEQSPCEVGVVRLAPGLYFVRVVGAGGAGAAGRFLVQR